MEHKFEKLTASLTLSGVLLAGCSSPSEVEQSQPVEEGAVISVVDEVIAPNEVNAEPAIEEPNNTKVEYPQIGDYTPEPIKTTNISFDPESVAELGPEEALEAYGTSKERQEVLENVLNNVGARLINVMQTYYFGDYDVVVQGSMESEARLVGPISGWSLLAHDPGLHFYINTENTTSQEDVIEIHLWQNEDGTFDLSQGIQFIDIVDYMPDGSQPTQLLQLGQPFGDELIWTGTDVPDNFMMTFYDTAQRTRPGVRGFSRIELSDFENKEFYPQYPTVQDVMRKDQETIQAILDYTALQEQACLEWLKILEERENNS